MKGDPERDTSSFKLEVPGFKLETSSFELEVLGSEREYSDSNPGVSPSKQISKP